MNPRNKEMSKARVWQWSMVLGSLLVGALVVVACSSNVVGTGSGMGTVNVMLSDPATCQAPGGNFSHVYVTVTDVLAHVSATASATDSGWVDLTPGLTNSPKQIDLLGQANNQCFLASLGSTQELQAGNYQQIRVILASNSASVANNLCGNTGAANCVVLSDSSVHTLNLSSEAQTGIKIPAGQISSGQFSIAKGQTKDLDIDFNTCSSIVMEGNGQYRLKPVLHAGEVSTTSTSINGTVLDGATGNAINGSVLVAVEQPDVNKVDRVVMSTLASASGGFVFCPLPAGTYDVVIVGTRNDGVMYKPAIVTGVTVGSTTGNIKLTLPTATTTSVATLNGAITSQKTGPPVAATVADVDLTVLEAVNSITYTIPLPPTKTQSEFDMPEETASSASCATNTDCVNYSLSVASGGASIGAWSASGVTLSAGATWATYTVDGIATVPGQGTTSDCTNPEMQEVMSTLTSTTLTVAVPNMAYTGCQ